VHLLDIGARYTLRLIRECNTVLGRCVQNLVLRSEGAGKPRVGTRPRPTRRDCIPSGGGDFSGFIWRHVQ
jgi:hypothetical protein